MIKKWHYIPVIAAIIIFIIVGSLYDLTIAKAMYAPNNWFGVTFAAIGELPAYMGLAFLGTGIAYLAIKSKFHIIVKIGLVALGSLGVVAGGYLAGGAFISHNSLNVEETMKWLGALEGIAVSLLGGGLGLFAAMKSKEPDLLRNILIMLAIVVVSLLFVTLVKHVMCRPRFRYLVGPGIEGEFHNWWEPARDLRDKVLQDLPTVSKDEFKSFPSGHTASSAFLIVLLSSLPFYNHKLFKYQTLFFYIGVLWMVIVAISRMTMGAHFLSDVSFGALIMVVTYLIFDVIFHKNIKIQESSEAN